MSLKYRREMDEELNNLFLKNETNAYEVKIFNVNNLESLNLAIKKIIEIQETQEIIEEDIKINLIKLSPGEYNKFYELPYNTFLEGINRDLVIFNFDNKLDYIRFTSNNTISNITINYRNNKLEDYSKLNLFYFDNQDQINYKVRFNNINFNFDDIYINNIFDIYYGDIEFNNCNFNINNLANIKFSENYNFFNLDSGTRLTINNSFIKLNINSIYYCLINSNLSSINFNNSKVEYIFNDFLSYHNKEYFIINDQFSNIDIENTRINNSSLGIKLFNLQDNLLMDNYIDYDSIIINDKFLEINDYKSKSIIEHLKGIYLNNIKYIFLNKIFLEDKVLISYNKISPKLETENKLLFRFNINNCFIYNSNLNLDNIYSQNYLINIVNTYIEDSSFQGLVNYYLNENGYLTGSSISKTKGIETNNIYSEKYIGDGSSLGNIGLKKVNLGYSLDKKTQIRLGKNSINLGFNNKKNYESGNNTIITGENNQCLGDFSGCFGRNNISEGNLSFIYGEGNISRYPNTFILGEYNDYLPNNIFSIGNGENDNKRSNALQLSRNGILKIEKEIISPKLTDGELNIENGNICGLKNIEVEDNIYCSGDLYLEGELKGKNLKNNEYIPNVLDLYYTENNNIIISTLKIDLKDLIIPNNLGGIIGYNKNSSICNIDENINGMIYKIKLFCIETPDFPEFRFIASNYKNLKKGALIENWHDFKKEENINLFHSYQWKKGKTKKNKEFEFSELNSEFNIYLARMPKLKNNIINKFTKGRFLLNIYGIRLF